VNVYHDDNHESIQSFDEVISTRQPWLSVASNYKLFRIGASTPIATFVSQNQPPNTNSNLVSTNSKMERLRLLNRWEWLHHINQRVSNQTNYIQCLKPIKPRATPTIVR